MLLQLFTNIYCQEGREPGFRDSLFGDYAQILTVNYTKNQHCVNIYLIVRREMGLGNCFKTDFRLVKSYLKGVRVWDEKK